MAVGAATRRTRAPTVCDDVAPARGSRARRRRCPGADGPDRSGTGCSSPPAGARSYFRASPGTRLSLSRGRRTLRGCKLSLLLLRRLLLLLPLLLGRLVLAAACRCSFPRRRFIERADLQADHRLGRAYLWIVVDSRRINCRAEDKNTRRPSFSSWMTRPAGDGGSSELDRVSVFRI